MAGSNAKLTQRTIDAAKPSAKRYIIGDTDIPGFRLHVLPSGKKAFYLAYRVGGGRGATQREPKIGDWPAVKAEQARRIAADWFAEVRSGGDPAAKRRGVRQAPRMSELFDRYLSDHARPHKKPSSIANDERLLAKRLVPAFGHKKVAEIARADVADFHNSLTNTPYEANRALALLSKAFNLAEIWEMRPEGTNPCRHVKKFQEKQRKRFLSLAELARLGSVMRRAENDGKLTLPAKPGVRSEPRTVPISTAALATIRLEVFTGARKGEILSLRWDWIDFENRRINLPDSKTGDNSIPLNSAALAVLGKVPRIQGNPHVIVGAKLGAALVNPYKAWHAIREAAGIDDVRMHDLRHSFASVGAGGGLSLPIIGALLGHKNMQTTQRYAHLADDPLKVATDAIGAQISAAMGDAEK